MLPENIYVRCDVDENLPKCRRTLSFVNVWFVCFISNIAALEFKDFVFKFFKHFIDTGKDIESNCCLSDSFWLDTSAFKKKKKTSKG